MKSLEQSEFQPSHKPSQNPRNYRKAVGIEAFLIWVYQDQFAHTVTVDENFAVKALWFGSGQGKFEELAQLGTLVQTSGGGGYNVHPDAEEAHRAVLQLPQIACSLVVMNAVAGTQPDWMPGETPRPVAVCRANGKPKLAFFDMRKRKPSHCLLRYIPEPELLAVARESYTVWWESLATLAASLDGLRDHELTAMPGNPQPWIIGC